MSASSADLTIKVAVLDMQPITPTVGGGRLRVLGLYHALGPSFKTTYIGTYDWPGERARTLRLSPSLVEIDVPLSVEHFRRDAQWRSYASGATIIDVTFPILGRLSGEFLSRAREAAADADVVVFSHPWLYPLVSDCIDRSRKVVVYDAQNVEGLLRYDLLGSSPFGRETAKAAAMAEAFLCREADLIIGCSDEDLAYFADAYGISRQKTAVVRNGVFVKAVVPRAATDAAEAKARVGALGPVVIFVGSNYRPNQEAATFITRTLAPSMPDVVFVLCGGIGQGAPIGALPSNVHCTGSVSDQEKLQYLHAADVAVNPMFSGSGTNIKMFDFMAAGLPVVSTAIGARGICDSTIRGVIVAAPADMMREVSRLIGDEPLRRRLGRANREWAEADFAWESLSPTLGGVISAAHELHAAAMRKGNHRNARKSSHEGLAPSTVGCGTGSTMRIGILSTFGIRCGIAEYTRYLTEALRDVGADMSIVANHLDGHTDETSTFSASPSSVAVDRVWRYDEGSWKNGADPGSIVRTLRMRGATHLNVQYHRAFFSEDALLGLARAVQRNGIGVSVTLHNSEHAHARLLEALSDLRLRVFVHQDAEAARLRHAGVDARHLPQGIRRLRDTALSNPSHRAERGPMIASFGFLRPHKGLIELVEALAILRGIFPDLWLLAQNSLYPSSDSRAYLDRVTQRIDALGLANSVVLETEFVPIETVVARLAQAAAIVLPYATSDEGSSAAAAIALAARRALVVTPAQIFDDVRGAAYCAEDNSPTVLAASIASVLSNGALRRHLERRARRLADARDWRNVAAQFLACIADGGPPHPAP